MIEFNVPGMSCSHCVSMVTRTVQSVDPQAKVNVDLDSKKVRVESSQQREPIARALTEAGYPPA
jgi:copper chaperone